MKGIGTKIDLDRLATEIRDMKRYHALYKVLKRELGILGFWRNQKRGNPQLGYKNSNQKRAP